MFLGIDSSTQSLTALILHADGQPGPRVNINFGRDLPHYACPQGFIADMPAGQVHSPPLMWLEALELALTQLGQQGLDLSRIRAIGGDGQQHGSVYLNSRFLPVLAGLDAKLSLVEQLAPCLSRSTSPIWMDNSTATECAEIAKALGGDAEVCRRSGSITTPRFTGPQIRAFSKRDPGAWGATTHVHLVSSFLASVLAGREAPIDFGDGAGMNLMNLESGQWDAQLVAATAPSLAAKLPPLASAAQSFARIAPYFVAKFGFDPLCRILPFTGDNPASLVGMAAGRPGSVVVSLGTSDTLFAAMPQPRTDPAGCGHVFGNPLGGFMTLACVRNGSLAREAFRDQLGATWEDFEKAAFVALPADAITEPFLFDEITPRRAAGLVESRPDLSSPQRIRAFLEGQARNLRAQLDWMCLKPELLLLTGGASKNDGISAVFSQVFGCPVQRFELSDSAALGAAKLAQQSS